MKVLPLLLMFLTLAPTLYAEEEWTGKNVLVSKGALLCDDSYIKKALRYEDAGDTDALMELLESRYCTVAPGDFYATVSDEKTPYHHDPIIEIMVNEQTAWMGKPSASCCYEKVEDEWVETGDVAHSTIMSDNSECGQAKRYLGELEAAGFAGTAQYQRQEQVKQEKCQ